MQRVTLDWHRHHRYSTYARAVGKFSNDAKSPLAHVEKPHISKRMAENVISLAIKLGIRISHFSFLLYFVNWILHRIVNQNQTHTGQWTVATVVLKTVSMSFADDTDNKLIIIIICITYIYT